MFVGLVDVLLDLFLSVLLVFSLVFILFLGIPPPIRERSSLRVPPYNIDPSTSFSIGICLVKS